MEPHVLLIDDDPTDTALFKLLFTQREGAAQLRVLHNPTHAFKTLLETAPDSQELPLMVLLDVNMPHMNGFEFHQKFKEQDHLRDIPVVFLSTSVRDADIDRALEQGADAYLSKGMGLQDMRLIVNKVMGYIQRIQPSTAIRQRPPLLQIVSKDMLASSRPTHLKIKENFDRASHMTPSLLPSTELAAQLTQTGAFEPEELALIISLLPDAVVLLNSTHRVMRINPGFTQLFGLDSQEIVGQTLERLYRSPRQYQLERSARFQSSTQNDPETFEAEFWRKCGEKFHAEVRHRQIRNRRGVSVGYLLIVRDTTERHLAALERDRALSKQERWTARMQLVNELTTRNHQNIDDMLRELLQRSCSLLGMEIGLISQVEGNTYTVQFSGNDESRELEGEEFVLGHTCCSITLREPRQRLAISNSSDAKLHQHPCYEKFRLESYLGVALRIDGALYGTLSFSSAQRRKTTFDDVDTEYIELLGSVVSSILLRLHVQQALRQERDMLKGLSDLQNKLATLEHDAQGLLEILAHRGRRLLRAQSLEIVLEDGTRAESISRHMDESTRVSTWVAPLTFDNESLGTMVMTLPGKDRRPDPRAGLELVAGVASSRLRDRAMVEQSQRDATIDPLTNVLNRRGFTSAVEHQIQKCYGLAQPFCLALFDLDHFKNLNDTYGHAMGDTVLRGMGELLRQEDGCIAGRWGGEEFVLGIPNEDIEQAFARVDKLRKRLSETTFHNESGAKIHVTTSAGVTYLQPADRNIQELLERADTALYEAKEYGRNRIVQTQDLYEPTEIDYIEPETA